MLGESAPWTFCQNNSVMLTYSHNHTRGILLWQCSCLRNAKQNSESFFNYDPNLTSLITMELKIIFFPFQCWFLCMTSLAVDVINVKKFREIWGTSFKFWLRPWDIIILLYLFGLIYLWWLILFHYFSFLSTFATAIPWKRKYSCIW